MNLVQELLWKRSDIAAPDPAQHRFHNNLVYSEHPCVLIAEYDFVGASTSDNEALPVPGGRGGCETDGALFAARITGTLGGFVHATYVEKITIITVRDIFTLIALTPVSHTE